MSISLCMIVKNEQDFITQCIDSVKGLAEQVIVVDTGSTDNTAELASKSGAEVHSFNWNDNTADARNESLKHARGDWILVLDADETISGRDFEKIRKLTGTAEHDGFAMVQRNYTNDTYREDFMWALSDEYKESRGFKGWVPRLIVRLFRNKPEIRFESVAHEIVENSIKRSGGKVLAADVPIHHFKELKPQPVLSEKLAHYRRIGGKKLAAEPGNPLAWLEMGNVERESQDFRKAKEYYAKAAELDRTLVLAYQGLGVCCSKLGEFDEAIAAFKKAIEINPRYPTPYFSLGFAYYRKGMLNESIRGFSRGLERNPNDLNALTNLAAIYEQSGFPGKAVEMLKKVVSADATNARAFYNLGVALEKLGGMDEAAAAYQKASELNYAGKR